MRRALTVLQGILAVVLLSNVAHGVRIERARGHYCGDATATVRLVDFDGHCSRATLALVNGGGVLRTMRTRDGDNATISLAGVSGRFEFRAWCGSDSDVHVAHWDNTAPTFTGITFHPSGSTRWANNPVSFSVDGVRDGGGWRTSEFRTRISFAGSVSRRAGLSRNLGSVSEGAHEVLVQVQDGCGYRSGWQSFPFNVDATKPTVAFRKPSSFAVIRRHTTLTTEVGVGDPGLIWGGGRDKISGLSSIKLYLDDLPGEFSPGQFLCSFPGPWMIGFASISSCSARADWTPGFHKLIAIAKDRAGNRSDRVERTIFIR